MNYSGSSEEEAMKISFTDTEPAFPYQSTEARQQLHIPDSPEIHLAITSLAERLLQAIQDLEYDPRLKRIAALRCASGAVLFSYPLELATLQMLTRCDVDVGEEAWAKASNLGYTDWLGHAVERLRREGMTVAPAYKQQVSIYGWKRI